MSERNIWNEGNPNRADERDDRRRRQAEKDREREQHEEERQERERTEDAEKEALEKEIQQAKEEQELQAFDRSMKEVASEKRKEREEAEVFEKSMKDVAAEKRKEKEEAEVFDKSMKDVVKEKRGEKEQQKAAEEWDQKEWQRQHDSMNEFEKAQYQRVLEVVQKREGKIISPKYMGYDTKMEIQCYDGHRWGVTPGHLFRNRWCPQCKTTLGESITREFFQRMYNAEFSNVRPDWLRESGNRLELDGFNEQLGIAFEYQGPHHYETGHYHTTDERLKETQEKDALKKRICKEKGIHLIIIPHTVPFGELQDFIKSECKKKGLKIPYLETIDYHEFIFYKKRLEKIRNKVEQMGGKLISEKYEGYKEKIEVECDRQHLWTTTPDHLLRGTWCPHFKGMKMSPNFNGEIDASKFRPDTRHLKHNIEEIRSFVEKKGGRLLSEQYIQNKARIYIECDKHHLWGTTTDHLLRGVWCPHHSNMQIISDHNINLGEIEYRPQKPHFKHDIEEIRKLVEAKGGRLISEKYEGYKVKIEIECDKHHLWSTTPDHLLRGSWCPHYKDMPLKSKSVNKK